MFVGRSEELKIGQWVSYLWQGNERLIKIEQWNESVGN